METGLEIARLPPAPIKKRHGNPGRFSFPEIKL